MRLAITSLLLAAAPLSAAAQSTGQDPRTLRGRIVDVEGAPVVDAEVEFIHRTAGRGPRPSPLRARVAEDGSFSLQVPVDPRGRLPLRSEIQISAPGRCTSRRTLTYPGPLPLDLGELQLHVPSGIRGSLVASDGALVVEGWTLRLQWLEPETGARGSQLETVDPASGEFHFDSLPRGTTGSSPRTRGETSSNPSS